MLAWGIFVTGRVPSNPYECLSLCSVNKWTYLAALMISSLCFSLRCLKRYEQNGGRLTPWCILTASVTVVPVCKSAGNCPVKFVFRDVTQVKILTFLLWVFISNSLQVAFSSFSPAPHFHLHLSLSLSSLFCTRLGHNLQGQVVSLGCRKQHQRTLSMENHSELLLLPPANNANSLSLQLWSFFYGP